jgi:hypothetical protein
MWGRITPIADGNHPNLYYNQSEIDELRQMVLVQHSPQTSNVDETELPGVIWEFFGYPRRIIPKQANPRESHR